MRRIDLQELINELSDLYRIPFMMHYRGYEYNEIALALQIPIGTVKSRIHYAKTKLKEHLNLQFPSPNKIKQV